MVSSAYIRLYGHKHNLSDDVLAVIADCVVGRDDELAELINAFRDQECLDDVEGNPLVAMDALGRIILDTLQPEDGVVSTKPWAMVVQNIGSTLIALAKDWTFDPACAHGIIDELRMARRNLHGWRNLLWDEDNEDGADLWIGDTLLPQLETIISVLEGHSNEANSVECACDSD